MGLFGHKKRVDINDIYVKEINDKDTNGNERVLRITMYEQDGKVYKEITQDGVVLSRHEFTEETAIGEGVKNFTKAAFGVFGSVAGGYAVMTVRKWWKNRK